MSTDLLKRLGILSGMIKMCEPISFGSDSQVMDEAAARIRELEAQLAAAEAAGVAKGLEASPDDLRALGLMVAVHNDYRLNGETHTFWLMTRKDGMSFKGEGKTDAEALNQIRTLSPSPGMVLVPREPSEAMLNAASDATDGQFEIDGDKGAWLPSSGFGAAYRAMIGAARE